MIRTITEGMRRLEPRELVGLPPHVAAAVARCGVLYWTPGRFILIGWSPRAPKAPMAKVQGASIVAEWRQINGIWTHRAGYYNPTINYVNDILEVL